MVVAGDLPLAVEWLKDGKPVASMHARTHQLDEYSAILSLSRLSLVDAGNYTCVASNLAGRISHSSVLKVKGKIFRR